MSRSKHTDPKPIRAARRIANPTAARGEGDLSIHRRSGVSSKPKLTPQIRHTVKIVEQNPNPGFHHPANTEDIQNFLRNVGAVGLYGLKEIILARAPGAASGRILLGQYEPPGRIYLFAQPESPWRLVGKLDREIAVRFENAGAKVIVSPDGSITLVAWPSEALRRFMLSEILLHELGHHVLQHYKGKRTPRAARTRDHEAFAQLFVAREQSRLAASDSRA